ncbi:hypothetical protein [Sphingomonas oligophenolica]|uniref:Uncharacterized protein n=1 Tax=Sphingomonas oligophenolica TaxID=301154 RepID=A0A502CBL9_9SPHN|nr:hypothetical protein [Sphingomonas oligophenolica]TPG10378.1 hypothetical protein EAH84_12400 [Sphingomonas oligophenolica]
MRMMLTALILTATPAFAQQAPAPVDTSASAAVAAHQVSAQPALPGVKPRTAPKGVGEVAKRAPINGVLVLYGNERCPTNTDGDEIVICERRDAQEQYRVPKELREFAVTPENESWAARAQGTLGTPGSGVDTIGSCSAVGAGGSLGCFAQQARVARSDKKSADKAANPNLP